MDGLPDQTAERSADLDWLEGDAPASRRHGDPYFSPVDGLAEARHVFLEGTGLPERMAVGGRVRVAELGFGTGLNFLAAWELWRRAAKEVPDQVRDGAGRGGPAFEFVSFEAAPLTAAEMARAHRRWPEIAEVSTALCAAWRPAGDRLEARFGDVALTVHFGDAREKVPAWAGVADAWFLDGFAPARNPEMWTPALMRAVFARTAPGGAAASYSAAGSVRRALAAAGFAVERRPGFAGKRHMTVARRP